MSNIDIRKRLFSFPRAKRLLKELDEFKITVIVPKIATMGLTPRDINTIEPDQRLTKTQKLYEALGQGDELRKLNRTKYSSFMYEEKLTVDDEIEAEYINGEINKKAYYKKVETYLPLSEIIQIFNNGYTVRTTNKETLIKLLEKLEYVYNNLETMRTPELEPVLELIENFYNSIIEGKGEELDNYLIKKRLQKSNSVLSLMENRMDKENLTVIRDKEGNSRVIDLSDLVVNNN